MNKQVKSKNGYTDGMITISTPEKSREMFDTFDKAALEGGKEPSRLQKIGKPKISYSEDYDKAFRTTRPLDSLYKAMVFWTTCHTRANKGHEIDRFMAISCLC
jgi:hypothetical protein